VQNATENFSCKLGSSRISRLHGRPGKRRFIGFTGHHDPNVHLAMLNNSEKYDTILMPLNPADPSYLSFENGFGGNSPGRGFCLVSSGAEPTGQSAEPMGQWDPVVSGLHP
jgi:hypothetical protein